MGYIHRDVHGGDVYDAYCCNLVADDDRHNARSNLHNHHGHHGSLRHSGRGRCCCSFSHHQMIDDGRQKLLTPQQWPTRDK